MKALVLAEYGRFEYRDEPEPRIQADEVLVRVTACGICGSDVKGMDGSTGRRRPPLVMGHEAAGVIEAVGTMVKDWSPGDRVTFDSTIFCGECWFCARGMVNLCDRRQVLGVSCEEYRRDGAFAEMAAVPARVLYRLPDEVSFEHAAMVESLSIALHAAGRAPASRGDSALVIGTGMVGLLIIQLLKRAGCETIIAVDLDDDRLALARSFSAAETVQAGARDPREIVLALTQGKGTDLAFEVVGSTRTLATAVSCVRKGGSLTLVGLDSPTVDLALQDIVTRQIAIRGSCASSGEYPLSLQLIQRKEVDVASLISAVADLSEGARWFERLKRREKGLMKVILMP